MEPQVFPGHYTDDVGTEAIEWWMGPEKRPDRFLIQTQIRGVAVSGLDFDMLEPGERDASTSFVVNRLGELINCRLDGELPVTLEMDGDQVPGAVRFEIDLYSSPARTELSTEVRGVQHRIKVDLFEQLLQLDTAIRPDRLVCCVTCQWSDYSPAGQPLLGIECHRDAKERYLAVRSKQDYWGMPVTEQVPETYRCEQWERRIPGTGYRG